MNTAHGNGSFGLVARSSSTVIFDIVKKMISHMLFSMTPVFIKGLPIINFIYLIFEGDAGRRR